MDEPFNDIAIRMLACLVEKENTTPDYYPLTLNSLTAACNQKSNRNPVVSYDEATVERELEELRRRGLVQTIHMAGSRTAKYRHSFMEEFRLIPREAAVLCELMLRGPQTMGEIRTHAGRMYGFRDLEEVAETLNDLMEREQPLALKLGRQPGQKEERYMHLLGGTPEIQESGQAVETAAKHVHGESVRIAKLEEEVSAIRQELETLKKLFEEFRSQFN